MNILILGSQGFIGRNIVKYLLAQHHNVTGCDLSEHANPQYRYHKLSILASDFETIFNNTNFELCINAAGSGNVSFSVEHPYSDLEGNTLAVARVLDALRRNQPSCKYLHISSAAVYGNPDSLPVSETAVLNPVSPYGYHKWMSEIICAEYHILYSTPVAIIRPFSLYGNGLRKQLLWDICSRLRNADKVELFGTGEETRDFISIDDLCSVIDIVARNSGFNNDVYNVANGIQTQIKEIAEMVSDVYPGDKLIVFNRQVKSYDPLQWLSDNSKITALGYKPKVSLKEGVHAYIEWYLSHGR